MNPSEKAFGEALEAHKKESPGKPLGERTIDELRAGVSVFLQYTGDPADVDYVDRTVPASDGFPLPIRIFNPHLESNVPVLIFYPGCAFIFDLFEMNSIICSRIAKHSGIKIILVQFRLAPEHPMPGSIYDGYDAAAYLVKQAEEFGIDPNQVILGGWCSGAHCAAAVSSLAREKGDLKVSHQILMGGGYDLTDSVNGFEGYEEQDKMLNRKVLNHFARTYFGIGLGDFQNPLLSPYLECNFTGLPSTTILVGEFDALRSDSEGYFRKLNEAGIPVEKILLEGQTHNTVGMRKVLSDGPDPAQVFADAIRRCN